MKINFLLMMPLIIPFLFSVIMLFIGKKPKVHRVIAALAGLFMIIVSIMIVVSVYQNGTLHTNVGNWPAPFGITVVYDMVAALLVLTTAILTFFVIIYSYQSIGIERETYYYYPMLLFMITGINGAFTTGDIFNMFVFFEVFLIASYVLIVIGSTKKQLREGFKYLVVNIVSSNFFVLGLGYLYSITGTLNMADIHVKLASFDGNKDVMTLVSIVFFFVFLTKAGIFPLYFWLPDSYSAPPLPILAIFGALLTKVGVYAMMRTMSLFFSFDQSFTNTIILALALITIIIGCIGALAYYDLKKVMIYNIMIAIGFIFVGITMMDLTGLVGAMYYLIHDMIIKAGLFLIIGFIIYRTGKTNAKEIHGLMSVHPVTGWMFFIAAMSLIGVPPLPGFYGKLFIVKSAFENGYYVAGIVVLLSSLVILYSIIRIFIQVFWGKPAIQSELRQIKYDKLLFSSFALIILSVVFGFTADMLYPLFEMAATSIVDPSTYADYIMGVE